MSVFKEKACAFRCREVRIEEEHHKLEFAKLVNAFCSGTVLAPSVKASRATSLKEHRARRAEWTRSCPRLKRKRLTSRRKMRRHGRHAEPYPRSSSLR